MTIYICIHLCTYMYGEKLPKCIQRKCSQVAAEIFLQEVEALNDFKNYFMQFLHTEHVM